MALRGDAVSMSTQFHSLGIRDGDVLTVKSFLPLETSIRTLFFHYDMRVHVAGFDGFFEDIAVHRSDRITFLQWVLQNMREFSHGNIHYLKFNGRVLHPTETFEQANIKDGDTIRVPRN
jgi:hypothetical protein